ncbi:relaxase/mobilization nuclease domain-containing protein [Brucella sp. NBRC 12950]|uniref:relaxase/mobilization nuclease domain-containing protein n=1 Tax=Brucella sp. NBRC 12950 TaxID=2994518 RepID=UPI0024A55DF7|nr:relaxase/mobilization nuclease domain-containing protein [Brucella sp. NBRC 12950]GLU27319.1 hypothetical protein Brsp01_25520 [Brucella sp. NBRC 12950]
MMCSASVFVTNRYEYFKNVGGLSHAPCFSRVGFKAASDMSRYARNVQRLPQVMFRTVRSGYCSGYIGLSAQLNYVLGKAQRVIDPSGEFDGEDHIARKDTQGLASRWADSWKKTAHDGKHTMHLVASFPHGTSQSAVEGIIYDTCDELLSQGRNRFDYIAAIHTDTNNPHGHIIVNRRNGEGEWFYLARDHEFTYDLFKDTLVKHARSYGVELNNSSRLSRGLGDYALDSNPKEAMRGLEGAVLDYGSAAYRYQESGSDSFYVTLQTRFGARTIWGVGLAAVLEDSGATPGDKIRIRHEGKKPVEVLAQDGKIITTHRNDWRIDFAGEEYGTFCRPETETSTEKEETIADRRRSLVLQEASRYRRFAEFCKGAQIALSLAFQAASEALHNGQTIDDLRHVQEDFMSEDVNLSEAAIARDRDALCASIEEAHDQLKAVWEHLPKLPHDERPVVEERYFKVVDDIDRLLTGERRHEFIQKAEGSVYADEHRRKLSRKIPTRSLQCLEQYGISSDEFIARTHVATCCYALESHWIERDVAAVAQHLNVDVHSEEGREAALRETAELHSAIIEDLNEAETLLDGIEEAKILDQIRDLARQDRLTLEESRTLIDNLEEVLGGDGMRDLQNANPDVFRKAGFEIEGREALSIAQAYCDAMSQHGYVMDASIQAIVRERELLVLNEQIAILEHDRELGDKAMEEELNERECYGL